MAAVLMTRPRQNPDRLLFGVIGSVPSVSALKKLWNTYFTTQGIDAFMDSYPTREGEIPERLSEMFHFDRRGYIVGKPLQEAILKHLDFVDSSAKGEGRVDIVVNSGGVMTGYYCANDFDTVRSLWTL